jgi:hypothetical protein
LLLHVISWGAGLAVGVKLGGAKPVADDRRLWKPTVNISIGYQSFPMVKPPINIYKKITPEYTRIYYTGTS